MEGYPETSSLKEVPVNEKTGLSPVYYMALGSGTFKIEPKIESLRYNEKEIVGWRIFIHLDAIVSLISNDTFQIPIQKVKGKVADFYTLYLDNSLFRQIPDEQNPQQAKITHPILEKIMYYAFSSYNKINSKITIEEIRDARRDNKKTSEKLNFSILYVDERISPTLILPTSNQRGYLNPEEEDILSLDDISNITLNIPKISNEKRKIIEELLDKMFLKEDFKNGSTNTRDLLEIYSCIKDYLNGKQPSQNGIVLYGPPGTGKTHLIQASLMEIYNELGFKTHFQEIGDMLSNQYVGGLATNVSKKIFGPAISLVKRYRVPCFVYIDEATDLLKKTSGSGGDSGWRAQGVEAMKSFINRSRYPGIIVCLATNLEKSEFDDALTRDGRLQKIYLGLPNFERCKQVWEYVNNKILFVNKESLQKFNSDQIEDLANICKDKINVASITGISETYVQSINLNWKGDFQEFKKYFGKEAIVRLEDELERAKSNLKGISSGNFIGVEELKYEIEKLENTFRKHLHEIELALDPTKPSTKQGVGKIFQNLFDNKNKVPKRYSKLVTFLKNWKALIERDPNHNPFSLQSISLIKGSLKFIKWLNENLDDNNYSQIKGKFTLISNIFSEIMTLNKNHYEFSNFDINKLTSLMRTIDSLSENLNDDSSSKSIAGNESSFLTERGFEIRSGSFPPERK